MCVMQRPSLVGYLLSGIHSLGLGLCSSWRRLRTGLIFGEYYFTPALGGFLTDNLPTLVPLLWFSLSYPVFMYTHLLVRWNGGYQHQQNAHSVLLASALLTGYDLISEPIGVLYGNQLWHHAAHVDSISPLDTFVPQPDWGFGLQTAAAEGSTSGWKKAYLDFLSIPCHYNIPLHVSQDEIFNSDIFIFSPDLTKHGVQNFLGWFVTSVVMFSCSCSCCPPLHPLYTQQALNKDKIKSPPTAFTYMHRVYLWLPVGAGLFCTQIFYLLHPCHPPLVRGGSLLYLLALTVIAYYYMSCSAPASPYHRAV